MKSKIFDNAGITFRKGNKILFYEAVEGDTQGRFVIAKPLIELVLVQQTKKYVTTYYLYRPQGGGICKCKMEF